MQFGAVLLAISGITLFAYVDGFESANILGVVLSVGAALGAALYKASISMCVDLVKIIVQLCSNRSF